MVADISIYDNKKWNPHANIMITMRPFENGTWGAKARKEYILNKNGEKIKLKSGEYKSRKIDTVDWNKKEKLEEWREQWENYANIMGKRGGQSERGQINKKIKELNSQIENIEKERYRFITIEEKEIIKKDENIVKKQLDRECVDSSVNKLNNIRRAFVDELNKLKFEPYSLKEDIRLMKGWSSDIENHKNN